VKKGDVIIGKFDFLNSSDIATVFKLPVIKRFGYIKNKANIVLGHMIELAQKCDKEYSI
jgi:hypothetical protein